MTLACLSSMILASALGQVPAAGEQAQDCPALAKGSDFIIHAIPIGGGHAIVHFTPSTGRMRVILGPSPATHSFRHDDLLLLHTGSGDGGMRHMMAPTKTWTEVAGVATDSHRLYVLSDTKTSGGFGPTSSLALHVFWQEDGKTLLTESLKGALPPRDKPKGTLPAPGALTLLKDGVACMEREFRFDGKTLNEDDAIAAVTKLGGKASRTVGLPAGAMNPVATVNLSGCRISDFDLEQLKRFRWLTSLSVRDTPMSDAGLDIINQLTKLHTLDLSFTRITDAGIRRLGSLRALQSLDVAYTSVTAAGAKDLKGAVPQLVITGP